MKSLFEPSEKMRNAMSTAIAELMALSPAELLALGEQYADSDTAHFLSECNHALNDDSAIVDHFFPRESGVGQWAAMSSFIATSASFVNNEVVKRGTYDGWAMADAMALATTDNCNPLLAAA
ncbi:hypothetical protein ACYCFK_09195 [Stutzerimonas stutzeri]